MKIKNIRSGIAGHMTSLGRNSHKDRDIVDGPPEFWKRHGLAPLQEWQTEIKLAPGRAAKPIFQESQVPEGEDEELLTSRIPATNGRRTCAWMDGTACDVSTPIARATFCSV